MTKLLCPTCSGEVTKYNGEKLAYTLKEGAAALSISLSAMWSLSKEGKVRFIKIGGRTLIPTKELLRLASDGSG